MKKFDLSGLWEMHASGEEQKFTGSIPGSVYSILLENQAIPDPFYRDNELDALELMKKDYVFSKKFTYHPEKLSNPIYLCCEGIDTLADLYLNGQWLGKSNNMHRQWKFLLNPSLQSGENKLEIHFHSPTSFIKEAYQKDPLIGSPEAMTGFPHLRKAHCMFGWDWGPRLPDAGIWRPIYLLEENSSKIEDIKVNQKHKSGQVSLEVQLLQSGQSQIRLELTTPGGEVLELQNFQEVLIPNPELWWPNGLGSQPLYRLRASLWEQDQIVDERQLSLGLRELTVVREKDQWGESFAQRVNGVCFFAMGADYIPEDNILSRMSQKRTRQLLEDCVAANFNVIRVWGGGFYPEDYFYDLCDELGLVVWQDFMFACANYHLTPDFAANIRQEFIDNVIRLRHHPSLGLWCGNNEMEMFQEMGEYRGTALTRSDYIRMFEHMIPEVLAQYDPETFYWPASPSSGGGFDEPNDPNRGDVHYWEVWHGGLPFATYRKYFFRYASEFGFQSFPCLKTVESFTLPEDRNIFSRVMEMHQRNSGANGKILSYLSQTYLYPTSFETLLYASQLLQAEAIRNGVEHWRRNRGRCMGAVYWQLNDIWPVASWASIDYYGRWKALHYYARRCFAPIMLSCDEVGETTHRPSVVSEPSPIETSAQLCLANETRQEATGVVRWHLRSTDGTSLIEGEEGVTVPCLSSYWLERIDFPDLNFLQNYFSYEFVMGEEVISRGSVLFTAPKHFHFQNPKLTYEILGTSIRVHAKAFAQGVEISSPDCDLLLSDNYFDIHGDYVEVEILRGNPQTLKLMSVYDIR